MNLIGYLQDKLLKNQPCVLCGKYTNFVVCHQCDLSLEYNNNNCKSCAIPLAQKTNLSYCGECLSEPPLFNATYALYVYEGWIKILIQQFKYQQNLALGRFFAKKIFYAISNLKNYDAIIPMPLHKKRLQNRGFNQVNELLRFVKKQNIDNKSCIRIKQTKEFNRLKIRKRNQEILGAFKVINKMTYQKILIVDDIMTTGSSVTELTKTILKSYDNNKPQIDILILARTTKQYF